MNVDKIIMFSRPTNTKILIYVFFLLASSVSLSFQSPPEHPETGNRTDTSKVLFDHKTYKDFSKGIFSDFGANLYVSQKGNIQFINLFDLNADGFPEVVINNDHNHYETPDLLIYHNRKPNGLRSLQNAQQQDAPAFQNFRWMMESLGSITRLPAEGGGKSLVADLNKDGYKDLIFTNFIHGSTLQNLGLYLLGRN
jgi:hypothetical protein